MIRIGSWLMKLLGRKGLALESELHAIETETETVSETVIDDTNVRRDGHGNDGGRRWVHRQRAARRRRRERRLAGRR